MRKRFTLLITVTALLLGSSGNEVWGQQISTATIPPYYPNYSADAVDNNITLNNIHIIGGRRSYSYDPYGGATGCGHDSGSPAFSQTPANSTNYYTWINNASVTVNIQSGQREYNRFMFGNMSLATVQQNRYDQSHNHSCSGNCGSGGTWCSSCCSCGPYTYYVWTASGSYLQTSNVTRPANIVIHGGARIHLTQAGMSIDRDNTAPAINAYTNTGAAGAALTHTGTTTITFPSSATDHFTLRMDGTFGAGTNGAIALANAGTLHSGDTLGVNGNYEHAQTWTTMSGQTGGTFQIGQNTDNTSRFTVLSGGTLMNYGNNDVHISNTTKLPVLNINGGSSNCYTYPTLITSMTAAVAPLRIYNSAARDIVFNNTTTPAPNVTFNSGGPLWITAGRTVKFDQGATFTVNGNDNYVQVEARGGDITTSTKDFKYTGGANNYNFIASNDITFSANSPVTITTNDACTDMMRAGSDITANANVKVEKNGTSNNTMNAVNGNFTVADGKTYTFDQKANSGDVLVRAGSNITMGGVVAVTRTQTAPNGKIEWLANTGTIWTKENVTFTNSGAKDTTLWKAGTNIRTDKDVTFTHSGTGGTTWDAGQHILTNDDIDFDNSGTGKTLWNAGNDIRTTGGTNPYQIDFNITGDAATEWHAGNDILTTGQDIKFNMTTTTKKTNWWANRHITSTNCVDKIDFVHTGTGDVEWWANTGSITVSPEILFTKASTTGDNGHTLWHAGVDINTSNNVTFTSSLNTNTGTTNGVKWNAGQNINVKDVCDPGNITVAFTNNSTHDDYMWWNAGQNINVDGSGNTQRITIDFLNKATDQDNAATNYMKWTAGTNIDVDYADVTFTTDINSLGYTEWYAGNNILMDYSKVDFFNNAITGNPHNDNTLWHAVTGNINAGNTPITFNNIGSGWTHWKAGNDILLHDQSPVLIDNDVTTNWLKFEAGRDIRTGINSPMLIDHKSPNPVPGQAANITAWAGRNIWTESSVDILNDGIQNQTWLYAGQDIRIDSTLTFTATNAAGVDWVRMRANSGDIIVNTRTADIQHPDPTGFNAVNDVCDARRAAVNFTLLGAASAGSTEWWAGKNIISNDTIHFHYDNTAHTVQDLWLHADVENIDLRRIMKIDFDSDSLIRWEALTQNNPARRQNKHSIDGGVSYNGTQHVNIGQFGNIRTSDSIIINRTYSGTVAGVTQIDAYNDIQTAMFNYTSANTVGDLTDITSRMGDIWLGYSWENPASCTTNNLHSPVSFDLNRFVYRVPVTTGGKLNIKAGYDDNETDKYGGGNIYFTHIVDSLGRGGSYDTEISIPYSNMFTCNTSVSPVLGGIDYERAGIIGGVWRCQIKGISPKKCDTIGFTHVGNNGNLLVDAGLRGNIIFNNGAFLNFQEGSGNAEFRTRWGDIDMRYPFDADTMRGSLLFLASSDLPNKATPNFCSCEEMRNNVYLQDFEYTPSVNSGSVFVGADNNIKLQYGGLKNIDTKRDPFWSDNAGYPCDSTFHCDADTAENNARDLILNFYQNASNANIVSGGFAAVASDRIDTYKNMIYNGGNGNGLSSVPKYGTLHGETVAGYGLYIKTQGDKKNWTMSDHDVNNTPDPWVGAACLDDPCTNDFLHNIARVTFHADARIYAENQIAFISSPVIDTYGNADYNTSLRSGSKTSIRLQADSLIYHDSLIIDGPKTTFSTWSGLYRDMPIIRLGHQRFTPPAAEDNGYCSDCYVHPKDTRNAGGTPFLDTVFVTFRNDASVGRLHTLVAEHAVISFLTDSFDHVRGNPTLNAKFYTDTFKIRNHVELFRTPDHTHDGHFELISEEQMESKDYAGIYSRHLHMEPIAPTCSDFKFSQLWLQESQLDVITSSTFGGFGWIHASVHVENEANLFPGFASLGTDGNCYEQRAGVLKMEDLRLDKGANVKVTVGDQDAHNSFAEVYECPWTLESIELGRYADCLIVDSLSIQGTLDIDIAIRSGLYLAAGESRCFPIIQYQAVEEGVLNNIHLKKDKLTSDDHKSVEGTYYLTLDADTTCNVVYLCVSTTPNPVLRREITIPSVPGITTYPVPGQYYVNSGSGFSFKAKFGPEYSREGEQLAVRTGRIIDGVEEVIVGIKNANGEYEYFIQGIRTNIVLTFGPDYVSADDVDGASVWSHDNMIYIRVDKEEIASIYLVTGQIVKQLSLSEGTHSVPTERGVYIVTLKDGSVHKVIVK